MRLGEAHDYKHAAARKVWVWGFLNLMLLRPFLYHNLLLLWRDIFTAIVHTMQLIAWGVIIGTLI